MGLGSFVGAFHLLNHSCFPNVIFDCRPLRSAEGGGTPSFALLTLRDVAAGEELCHCYAGSADGPSVRQTDLLDHHGFRCGCPRCSCADLADELAMASALDEMRCPAEGCGTGLGYVVVADTPPAHDEGLVVRLRCVHCGGEWDSVPDD